jgi:hypothetical protein
MGEELPYLRQDEAQHVHLGGDNGLRSWDSRDWNGDILPHRGTALFRLGFGILRQITDAVLADSVLGVVDVEDGQQDGVQLRGGVND